VTPDQIREIRSALNLSQRELGQDLGLTPDNADRVVRRWESGQQAITGPSAVALAYLGQGALDDTMKSLIPEHVVAADALGEIGHELVIRLWRPRCLAIVTEQPFGQAVPVDGGVEYLSVALWIDDPARFNARDILGRMAAAFSAYTADSL